MINGWNHETPQREWNQMFWIEWAFPDPHDMRDQSRITQNNWKSVICHSWWTYVAQKCQICEQGLHDAGSFLCTAPYDRRDRVFIRPSVTLYGYHFSAATSKSYDLSTNYHVCIALPTWCRYAPLILFWPWPLFNLFPRSCLTWIFINLHWGIPLSVHHPANVMTFQQVYRACTCTCIAMPI